MKRMSTHRSSLKQNQLLHSYGLIGPKVFLRVRIVEFFISVFYGSTFSGALTRDHALWKPNPACFIEVFDRFPMFE